MTNPKRYTQWCAGPHGHQMSPDERGAWVLFDDIKHLLAPEPSAERCGTCGETQMAHAETAYVNHNFVPAPRTTAGR